MKMVIVDDNADFAAELGTQIARNIGIEVKVINPVAAQWRDTLRDFVGDTSSVFALIDRVIPNFGSILPLLEDAVQGLSRDGTRIHSYVLTGYDLTPEESVVTLDKWRSALGALLDVRGALSKPISAEAVLPLIREAIGEATSAFPTPNPSAELHEIVRNFAIPARLISEHGELITFNDAWSWGGNSPDPQESDDGHEFYRTTKRDDGAEGLVAYRLATSTSSLRQQVQIAMAFDHRLSGSFDGYLENVYKLLQQMGFTRMRYFRRIHVPGSQGVISLERWFGSPAPDAELLGQTTWRKGRRIYSPLEGYLASRVSSYDTAVRPPREFVWKVGRHNDEASHGDDWILRFWNDIVQLRSNTEWLEFPVLCRTRRQDKPRYQAEGLIIADMMGTANENVEVERVRTKAVSLRLHCVELARVIESELERARARSLERARSFYMNNAPRASDPHALEHYLGAMAEEARLIMGADVALVCWIPPGSTRGVISAGRVRDEVTNLYVNPEKIIGHIVRSDNFPALFNAIDSEQPFFAPDGILYDTPDGPAFTDPLSRVGIPIKIGSRIIGAIGFVDQRTRRFTERRVDGVSHLVDSCAPVIEYLGAALFRSEWESSWVHEVRKLAINAREALDDVAWPTGYDVERALANWQLDLLLDQTGAFYRLSEKKMGDHPQPLDPSVILVRELESAGPYAQRLNKSFDVHLLSDVAKRIFADESGFEFVVRTMLDNAMRHGEGITIGIEESVVRDRWILTVTNDGSMTEEENRLKYEAYARLSEPRRDGSHIALAASVRFARTYSASLTVDNKSGPDGDQVVATLSWPVA